MHPLLVPDLSMPIGKSVQLNAHVYDKLLTQRVFSNSVIAADICIATNRHLCVSLRFQQKPLAEFNIFCTTSHFKMFQCGSQTCCLFVHCSSKETVCPQIHHSIVSTLSMTGARVSLPNTLTKVR